MEIGTTHEIGCVEEPGPLGLRVEKSYHHLLGAFPAATAN